MLVKKVGALAFGLMLSVPLLGSKASAAIVIMEALTSFSGDGWLAPTETTFLQGGTLITPNFTAGAQRGMTYDGASDRVYVVDRNAGTNVRVFNGTSGAFLNSLDMTGVSGGAFAGNMIDVGDDGAIYMGNLQTSAAANFSVYRWANGDVGTVPTVAFSAPAGGIPRVGDSFAVFGSGAATRIIASGSGSSSVALLTTTDGTSFSLASATAFTGTPPIGSGAFRLGLDFVDANTIVGKQTGTPLLVGSFASPTTTAIVTVAGGGEAPLAYSGVDAVLATIDANSSLVRFYDAASLSGTLAAYQTFNLTTAFNANGNATGDLAFGVGPQGLLRLYALNTNNGIQAFQAVPEPSSIALATLGVVGIIARRRQLANRKQVS